MANKIKAAVRSGSGCIRSNNEDAYFFNGRRSTLDNINEEAAFYDEFQIENALFSLSDGIGGANSGEIASDITIKNIKNLQARLKSQHFTAAIGPWLKETNKIVFDTVPGGGCTLVLLYFDSAGIYAAHIGDSRIYRLHDRQLTRLTKDHSKVQLLIDAGILTPEKAATHPQRNMVVKYIGMDEEENGVCAAALTGPLPITHGDRYLLCTDGITDMIDDNKLESILKQETNTDACAESIYRAALDAGGRDNATLILLDLNISDEGILSKQSPLYSEDELESALDAPPVKTRLPSAKEYSSNTLSIRHVCRVSSDQSGKRLTIRTEITSTADSSSKTMGEC